MSRSILFACAATLATTAASSHAAIVLTDASFEANDIADTTFSQNGVTTGGGWTSGGGTASTYLLDNASNTWFTGNASGGGPQSLSLANGFITQQLNDNVTGAVMTGAFAQQFDISFFVGARQGTITTGTFTVLLQAYNGVNFVGNLASQVYCLGSDSNLSTIDLGLGSKQWTGSPISLSLTAAANTFSGNNIRLVFAANTPFGTGGAGGEAAIDNVSIVAVPEPAVALLGGLGLLGLLRRRRV